MSDVGCSIFTRKKQHGPLTDWSVYREDVWLGGGQVNTSTYQESSRWSTLGQGQVYMLMSI